MQGVEEVLAFELDAQTYAGDIVEIVRAVALLPLPGAPSVIEGVFSLRGTVIPVLDMRRRFQLPPKVLEPSDQLVIARAGSRLVAIRTDRALGLLQISQASIAPVGAIAPTAAYIKGIATLPDGMVLIHDLATFLSQAESETLDRVVPEGSAA